MTFPTKCEKVIYRESHPQKVRLDSPSKPVWVCGWMDGWVGVYVYLCVYTCVLFIYRQQTIIIISDNRMEKKFHKGQLCKYE